MPLSFAKLLLSTACLRLRVPLTLRAPFIFFLASSWLPPHFGLLLFVCPITLSSAACPLRSISGPFCCFLGLLTLFLRLALLYSRVDKTPYDETKSGIASFLVKHFT